MTGLPPFFGDGLFNHPHESEDVLPNLRPIELRQARRKGDVRPPIVVNCCDDATLFNVTLKPVRDRGSFDRRQNAIDVAARAQRQLHGVVCDLERGEKRYRDPIGPSCSDPRLVVSPVGERRSRNCRRSKSAGSCNLAAVHL